jgi:hypothetical protein
MEKAKPERKCNIYYDIWINNKTDAKIFSREISWDIIETVRKSGAKGITAKEISEEYKYPIKTIYQALNSLENSGWIDSTTRHTLHWGRSPAGERQRVGRDTIRGGKPREIYRLARHLTPTDLLDEEFSEEIAVLLKKCVKDIKEVWIGALQKIINEIGTEDFKKFLPLDEIQECDTNHEGYEFLTAISLGLLRFTEDEEEWKNFARKNKIIK